MNRQMVLGIRLRDDATFGNYVGQAGERLAFVSGLVYVWGHPESGRSHLLQACCHQSREAGHSAICLSNLGEHDPDVLSGLESIPVICLDDIDQIAGDERWDLALFHLINAVVDAGGKLVVSARVQARFLTVGLKDVHSRLLAAETIRTDHLNDHQRLQVLKQRADIRGFTFTDDVGKFIMGRIPRGMHSLLEVLQRLEVETLVQQRKVTIPLVKETLGI